MKNAIYFSSILSLFIYLFFGFHHNLPVTKDHFAKSNTANVRLCLISGCIGQSSQYNVGMLNIKILTLIIEINFFSLLFSVFVRKHGYMLVSLI